MAGRHRKTSRPAAVVAMVVAPAGLAVAAMAATSMTGGVTANTTEAAKPQPVDLLAVITPANSTAQIFAGATYYGTNYTQPPASTTYGPQVTVPFFQGPAGIADAITAADDDPTDNKSVVLASGWGAGQTGTALGTLLDEDLSEIDYVILDNNSNRAAGGFWTTYAPFAPLLGTSSEPTPDDLAVPVLDVAYQYNINSNAAVDPLNPFAVGNSLAAYVFGYGGQSSAEIPDAAIEEIEAAKANPAVQRHHYIVRANGDVDVEAVAGNITYVTYESENLPLTRALRLLPGGDLVADAIDPTLTKLVNAGYNDGLGEAGNEAIPLDPTVPRPMKPGSSLSGLGGVPATIPAGLDAGVNTAKDDLSNPANLVTKPLAEAAKLPGISSLTNLSQSTSSLTNASKAAPETKTATSSSTGSERPKPLKKIADDFNSSLKKFANEISKNKPAETENDED